jgi:hypothetical protein
MPNIQFNTEQLRKKKIFIATPMYGGVCCGMYMKSCLDLQNVLGQYGIESRFSFIFNESLITRARNYLADEFLRAKGTPIPVLGYIKDNKLKLIAIDGKTDDGKNNYVEVNTKTELCVGGSELVGKTLSAPVKITAENDDGTFALSETADQGSVSEPLELQIIPAFTNLLFLDSDIHYDPRDVLALLALDKDVIGGPYPKKSIKWQNVIAAVQKNVKAVEQSKIERERVLAEAKQRGINIPEEKLPPILKEITPDDVSKLTGDYVFNAVAGTGQFNVGEPLKVLEIGTGFMMIKRDVFPQFEMRFPQLKYKPDHVGQAGFDGSRYIHAYFDTIIDRQSARSEAPGNSERYLSEDYMFCQLWRKMGGEIWLCPWMKTHHIGSFAFQGDMPAVAAYIGSL